ncbi:MAG: cell envelope integrity protein CreD [Saprospiraceae bacterium]|nr:cell envelope integrity protein CreD [Saprospiraceae bacterium]
MEHSESAGPESGFWQRQGTTLKGVIIFFLVLVLLIPTFMVEGLIHERESRQNEAVLEVSNKWGNQQTLSGPVLVLPYEQVFRDQKGQETSRQTGYLYFLPDELKVNGSVNPEKRYRGIFEVVLYSTQLALEGTFGPLVLDKHLPADAVPQWDKAVLVLGIPDLRGLKEQVTLEWGDQKKVADPGIPVPGLSESGIHVPLNLSAVQGLGEAGQTFRLNAALKGSGSLFFTPLGKVSTVHISSSWPDPSFTGAFLPDDKTISPSGFEANWKILNLNRNYPQQWNSEKGYSFTESAFGVEFLLPVDNYQKSTRSVKYAILFIGLTFLCVFFVEMRQSRRVHPFQYALIGLAMVIFYTLLVSFSEHIRFNPAYLLAASMTVGLTGLYARSLFQSTPMGLLIGGTLTTLYGFLFVTLQLQDYALLIGSLGLFAILATVMYFSRRISWYSA